MLGVISLEGEDAIKVYKIMKTVYEKNTELLLTEFYYNSR